MTAGLIGLTSQGGETTSRCRDLLTATPTQPAVVPAAMRQLAPLQSVKESRRESVGIQGRLPEEAITARLAFIAGPRAQRATEEYHRLHPRGMAAIPRLLQTPQGSIGMVTPMSATLLANLPRVTS